VEYFFLESLYAAPTRTNGYISGSNIELSDIFFDPRCKDDPDESVLEMSASKYLFEAIANSPDRFRDYLLKGKAGQGKTTLLKFLAQLFRAVYLKDNKLVKPETTKHINKYLQRDFLDMRSYNVRRFPLYIHLPAFFIAKRRDQTLDILGYIHSQLIVAGEFRYKANMNLNDTISFLRTLQLVLLLDGWDELNECDLPLVETEISKFKADRNWQQLFIIISTRTLDERAYSCRRQLILEDLSEEEEKAFGKRLLQCCVYLNVSERTFEETWMRCKDDLSLKPLLSNSTHLTMIAFLIQSQGKPSTNVFKLYRDYYGIYSEREFANEESRDFCALHSRRISGILKLTAFWMLKQDLLQGGTKIPQKQFETLLIHLLDNERVETNSNLIDNFHKVLVGRLTVLRYDGECYEFTLPMIRDFMAAECVLSSDSFDDIMRLLVPLAFGARSNGSLTNVIVFILAGALLDTHLRNRLLKLSQQLNTDSRWRNVRLGSQMTALIFLNKLPIELPSLKDKLEGVVSEIIGAIAIKYYDELSQLQELPFLSKNLKPATTDQEFEKQLIPTLKQLSALNKIEWDGDDIDLLSDQNWVAAPAPPIDLVDKMINERKLQEAEWKTKWEQEKEAETKTQETAPVQTPTSNSVPKISKVRYVCFSYVESNADDSNIYRVTFLTSYMC